MPAIPEQLRVGLVTGSLSQGGAEKQLVYMARALHEAGVQVRVYSLTRGEYYEPALQALGLPPEWAGRLQGPLLRTPALAAAVRPFRPHLLQSATFFTNLYTALAAPLAGAVSIGCLRSDLQHSFDENGRWGPWLLRLPKFLMANSARAGRSLLEKGIRPGRILVVPNVIDLEDFDGRAAQPAVDLPQRETGEVRVITVARLVPAKRLERFLQALHDARAVYPGLRGVIAGDGPEKARLLDRAAEFGLLPHGVSFLGRRDDVPALLKQADIFMLTSAHEGFPNALIEAMAAGLPVIATPAGDSAGILQDGLTGFVVPHDDPQALADRLVELAHSAGLRRRLGAAGRQRVEIRYNYRGLTGSLFAAYQSIAEQTRNQRVLRLLGNLQ